VLTPKQQQQQQQASHLPHCWCDAIHQCQHPLQRLQQHTACSSSSQSSIAGVMPSISASTLSSACSSTQHQCVQGFFGQLIQLITARQQRAIRWHAVQVLCLL
jgi:hypothetical protein